MSDTVAWSSRTGHYWSVTPTPSISSAGPTFHQLVLRLVRRFSPPTTPRSRAHTCRDRAAPSQPSLLARSQPPGLRSPSGAPPRVESQPDLPPRAAEGHSRRRKRGRLTEEPLGASTRLGAPTRLPAQQLPECAAQPTETTTPACLASHGPCVVLGYNFLEVPRRRP